MARYRTSGLTIARFCATEGVSVNTFYYWARRVATAEAVVEKTASSPAQAPAVRFQFAADVTVWVPAECVEVIRCLAECAQRSTVAASERAPLGAFREVVLAAPRGRS